MIKCQFLKLQHILCSLTASRRLGGLRAKQESYANDERFLLCLHLCMYLAIFADRQISSPADGLISRTEVKNHSLIPEAYSPSPQCMHALSCRRMTGQAALIHMTKHGDFKG